MNFNIIPENNKATIVITKENVIGIEALNALKNATTLCFKAKADKETVALDLQRLANTQIGSWTKFWDALGSIFLSCFGYVTTSKKVQDIVNQILNKNYEIEGEKQQSPKQKSPKLTPEQIQQKEAKEFVDNLLPDLSKLQSYYVNQLAETLKEQIEKLDADKQAFCYEYLVGIDHHDLAIKFIDNLKPEVQQSFKDKYGLCPEFRDIAKNLPGFEDCIKNQDFKKLKMLLDDLKSKNEISEAFYKFINIVLIFEDIKKLSENELFDEASKLIEKIRFLDLKKEASYHLDNIKRNFERNLHELYKQDGHENLNKYLEALPESRRNEAFYSLASVSNFDDAKTYAAKITDAKLREEARKKYGLLTDEECLKALSDEKFENIRKNLSSHNYLSALDDLYYNVNDNSVNRYVAVVGAEYYLKQKDYARLDLCIRRMYFEDLKAHYVRCRNEISPEDLKRSKFFYGLAETGSWYASKYIEKESDPALKAEGYEYIINKSQTFSEALRIVSSIQDAAIKTKMIQKYGLLDQRELEALPQYGELERLLKLDRMQAKVYVKGLNSQPLYLHYLRKAVDMLIEIEEYEEASLLLAEIPFKSIRDDFIEKIKKEKEDHKSKVAEFVQEIQNRLLDGHLNYIFDCLDQSRKPSYKEAALVTIASQFIDSTVALQALDMIQNPELKKRLKTEAGLLQLEDINNNDAKTAAEFLKNNEFNSARRVVDRSKMTTEKKSLHRIIDTAEIRYNINQSKPLEAERLINRLSYRNQRQELGLEVEKLKAQLKFPNIARAITNKNSSSRLTPDLSKLGKESVDLIFKDIEACDEYYVEMAFDHYYDNNDFETVLSLGFLVFKRAEYYMQTLIKKAVIGGNIKALEWLRILSWEDEMYIIKEAFEKLYFKDKAFVNNLISKYGNVFESSYSKLVDTADNKESAIELLSFIKDRYLLNKAKSLIARKYGDLKLFIEAADSIGWEYYFDEFSKNYKRCAYTSDELKSMEDIVDGLYCYDREFKNKLYAYLSELATDEADKVRLNGKKY